MENRDTQVPNDLAVSVQYLGVEITLLPVKNKQILSWWEKYMAVAVRSFLKSGINRLI